jgi:hypothetical protein
MVAGSDACLSNTFSRLLPSTFQWNTLFAVTTATVPSPTHDQCTTGSGAETADTLALRARSKICSDPPLLSASSWLPGDIMAASAAIGRWEREGGEAERSSMDTVPEEQETIQ